MAYTERDKNFAVTIKEYIDSNYADKNISIGFISELVGYSIMRINDVYKKRYGMTPMEYLSKKRIEKVKGFIEDGIPLGKAADAAGYGSIRTFYRVFKEDTGMPPEKYKVRIFSNYERFKGVVQMKDLRPLDYAKKQCDSIMLTNEARILGPHDPKLKIGIYSYHQGMFLQGMYYIYLQSKEKKYFSYMKEWVDSVVDENGKVQKKGVFGEWITIKCLDFRQPSRILLSLYEATNDERYMKLIDHSIESLLDYPTTSDGGFWHRFSQPYQMRLEGLYMAGPVMCLYAKKKKRPEFYDIAVLQTELMYKHTLDKTTGLLRHAWDEKKEAEWADADTGMSPYVCGRPIGFFVAAVADIIDFLPSDHPKRQTIIDIEKNVLNALIKYQDETGRWYHIVDKAEIKGNWLENSCSCLIVYALAKAVNLGIAGAEHEEAAIRGYAGVIDTISYGNAGEMLLGDICLGSNLSKVIEEYFDSDKCINNLHGSGAFVLMCTEVEKLLNNNV